jgi:hypothetical protein
MPRCNGPQNRVRKPEPGSVEPDVARGHFELEVDVHDIQRPKLRRRRHPYPRNSAGDNMVNN